MSAGRAIFLSTAGVGIAAIAWSVLADARPLLIYNASASTPIGFYWVADLQPLQVGDWVVVTPPNSIQLLIGERGYLPAGTPLVKRVAATAGDHVCARSNALLVDGIRRVERVLDRDSQGRPLPLWTGCRTLRPGEVFLLTAGVPSSLDSRIFGPVRAETIIGKAVPLWTF